MYPVQYLRKNTTTRVPGLGPTAKFVGTMVQAPKIKGSSVIGKKKPGALEMDLGKGENALLPWTLAGCPDQNQIAKVPSVLNSESTLDHLMKVLDDTRG